MSSKSSKPQMSSSSNGKQKNKKLPLPKINMAKSTSRVAVSSLQAHPIFGGRLTSNVDSLPAAFVNIIGNSTYYGDNGRVMMPDLGIDPVNIVGCQPFSDITGAVATPDVFTTGTLATATNVNNIILSPDTFNGPLAAKANLYDKYVFRDILIEYVSACATSQANAIAMCVTEDVITPPTSFSTVRQVVPSITFPLRADRAFLHYHYKGPQLFYNLLDSATNAGFRASCQGNVVAYSSANLTVIVPGFTNVYYSVDLYDPVASQGFTVSVSKVERDYLRQILKNIRALEEVQREKSLDSILDLTITPKPVLGLGRK